MVEIQETLTNAGAAMTIVPLLEALKRSPAVRWINSRTAPYISVLTAFVVAAGIHWTFDGQDTITVTFTLSGLTTAAVDVLKQWLGQHWMFKVYQGFENLKTFVRLQANFTAGGEALGTTLQEATDRRS